MTDSSSTPPVREAVGLFRDRDSFEAAVNALTRAGFDRTDLSVLSSHESIDAAGKAGHSWRDAVTAMVGEVKYEGPLVASVAILLVGGPFAGAVAGLVGAATAGVALKELVEEVTSAPDTEDFARSLEAGSVILWVATDNEDKESQALSILRESGGDNVHIHEHQPGEPS